MNVHIGTTPNIFVFMCVRVCVEIRKVDHSSQVISPLRTPYRNSVTEISLGQVARRNGTRSTNLRDLKSNG